jgi:hypothetical protein
MTLVDNLYRASHHEAGRACASLHFNLPIREVVIRRDGSGHTAYARWHGADAEAWAICVFSGPEAENDLFLDGGADDAGDLLAIIAMLRRLDLDWGACKLAVLRFEAQILVARLCPRIRAVAHALIEPGSLTAAQIAEGRGYPAGRPAIELGTQRSPDLLLGQPRISASRA